MKFSERWLREWVDPPVSTDELSGQLTMAGLEVEGVTASCPEFTRVVVARVERIEDHPGAEGLRVCRVDAGSGRQLTVVCGADNVFIGSAYPLALEGARLAAGRLVQTTKIKGVQSEGMLCSSAELGLSDVAERLLELDVNAPVGAPLEDFLALDDRIFEISLTPNRGDCLSIAGIAREVGVLNNVKVRRPTITPVTPESEARRQVVLDVPQACPCYAGRIIEEIDIRRPTPVWMVEKLRRGGLRSINIIVDITNFVMLELGQPMHAFDNSLLSGAISVRYSRPGEQLQLLDGSQIELLDQTLVIADQDCAVAMAGIMGGLATAVSAATRSIFLESAYFNAGAIAGRARRYGMATDSSHRYERGVDFRLQETALERATGLIMMCCGGRPGPVVTASTPSHLPERTPVSLRTQRLEQVLGTSIEARRVTGILRRLGMTVVSRRGGWEVTPPSFRFDIGLEIDLIEEIARIHGYDHLPSAGLRSEQRITPIQTRTEVGELRRILVERGYHEAITYSFVDERLQQQLADPAGTIALLNPISSELGVMRQSLWPGLLAALQYNLKRQQQRLRLFEHGRIFYREHAIRQELSIAGIVCGNVYKEQWDIKGFSSCFYDIKNDLEALVCSLAGQIRLEYRSSTSTALHPGQSADIIIENQIIGQLGTFHPRILRELEIRQPVFGFQLYLSRITPKKGVKFAKISKFPSVRRDLSIVLQERIPVQDILNCIEVTLPGFLENLQLFDVYRGEGIEIDEKSLALGLTFQGTSSTLTDEEVEEMVQRVMCTLQSEFGATLRE